MKKKAQPKKIHSSEKSKKANRVKRERKLDKTLEDTFPASDATAQY